MKKKQEHQTQPTGRVYQVTITETRRRTVTVHESELKAPTPDDAEQIIKKDHRGSGKKRYQKKPEFGKDALTDHHLKIRPRNDSPCFA